MEEVEQDEGCVGPHEPGEKSAVGRRYRRQDEAGTPYCVTVDGQTNEDNTVTVRDRDSMDQTRVSSDQVVSYIRDKLGL